MSPSVRKVALTAHIALSVGWLGAVIAYLPLAISAFTTADPEAVRRSCASMEFIGWAAIVPLSLGALATGLVQSFGTQWGLFRYYWVLTKFILTVGCITVLLLHMPTVSRMARSASEFAVLRNMAFSPVSLLLHAVGGLVLLLLITAISVFKPWGTTPYGQRKLAAIAAVSFGDSGRTANPLEKKGNGLKIMVLTAVTVLLLVFILMHLLGVSH